MASDYDAIRKANLGRFGTDIGRIGRMLLADRYDDRTHFIYELLQNAEDALRRRTEWTGPRSVAFDLSADRLRVEHYGIPFDHGDVESICGIGESRKGLTAIGHFGIGFKSVYSFTDRPEIHSGEEHFAIESFVWPCRVPDDVGLQPGQTVMLLPFRDVDADAHAEITMGLSRLGPRSLLFLREIEEISWRVDGGASGCYRRTPPRSIADDAREVALVGEETGRSPVEERWLVFSRPVHSDGERVGYVEIAFSLRETAGTAVRAVRGSQLSVFFPTVLSTNLGFLAQGPYRTTPSRDNVPRHDPWNQALVRETGELLVSSLRTLRELGSLNSDALQCLPLDAALFGEDSMFTPVFERVRQAFEAEPLLPAFRGGHLVAAQARLARTQDLRELLSPGQLSELYGSSAELRWLAEDITQDRTPTLRQYLMQELGLGEMTLESILPLLSQGFLEAQADEWIAQLYEVLQGQPALVRTRRLSTVPLVRLADGAHVPPPVDGQLSAFLPGPVATGFPTVSDAVLTPQGRALLTALGLTEPDPVDDMIRNILPKYVDALTEPPKTYAADIDRVVKAFGTDSMSRRTALVDAARDSHLVAAVDAGTGVQRLVRPATVYLATQRMKELFEGIAGVLLADDSLEALHGEGVRELFEACGASRYLVRTSTRTRFNADTLASMRRDAGWAISTGGDLISDVTIRGLDAVLEALARMPAEKAAARARVLWDALCDLDDRSGPQAFAGTYSWWYVQQRSCAFDAAFVRALNSTPWIPDENGALRVPDLVVFDDIRPPWEPNPRLQSRIRFKPPVIRQLETAAGFEPGVLDLLKSLGITNKAELEERLGVAMPLSDAKGDPEAMSSSDPSESDGRREEADTFARSDQLEQTTGETAANPGGADQPEPGSVAGDTTHRSDGLPEIHGADGQRPGQREGGQSRTFISYVAVAADEGMADPDGLSHERRMALEERAIVRILGEEPRLRRTPPNNAGFDLFEEDDAGVACRWIEVKAMAGTLTEHPVGMTRSQFETAQQRGELFWLYVVEHAGDDSARILRIQDPAGTARTFTFDSGWIAVAEDDESAGRRISGSTV